MLSSLQKDLTHPVLGEVSVDGTWTAPTRGRNKGQLVLSLIDSQYHSATTTNSTWHTRVCKTPVGPNVAHATKLQSVGIAVSSDTVARV